jgi:hypothetical protein
MSDTPKLLRIPERPVSIEQVLGTAAKLDFGRHI